MSSSSIIGAVGLRIAKLVATGAPDFNNATGGWAMCGGLSTFEFDFETETGADIYEVDGGGNPCVVRKKPDIVKRVTFTLTVCRQDYRIDEILDVADAVTDGGNVVGRTVQTNVGCGVPFNPPGVSLELWSEQWDCDVPLAGKPYMRTILPRAYLTPKGYTIENGVSMPQFTGYGTANNLWGDGPFGDADVLSAKTGWCFAQIDDAALPFCPPAPAYINIPPTAS